MEPGYGSIAYTSRQLQQLLQKALEQVFPNCKIKQIPIGTSFLDGQGVFSSGLAFVCAASKGISPAEAADQVVGLFARRRFSFSKIEKNSGYLNFHPSPRWYTESVSFLLRSASFFSLAFLPRRILVFSVLLLPPWLNCKNLLSGCAAFYEIAKPKGCCPFPVRTAHWHC